MKLNSIALLVLLVAALSNFCAAQAREDFEIPLYSNFQLKKQLAKSGNRTVHFGKRGIKDTLELPFFDDFSHLGVIPNDSLWVDAAVFINADFPINPPSIGVATFDGLNSAGNPYEGINGSLFGPADTLTSQPISLESFTLKDSLYLSFFYQAQGLSFEPLAPNDSLVLQFRNRIGAWVNVWSTRGIPQAAFLAANVAVSDTSYLHGAFQFRWINYQFYLGNIKQWHLDYVYMNQGRNAGDIVFEDQALVYLPDFPLTPYTHMPWNQLQLDFAKYVRPTFNLPVGNLALSGETFSIGIEVKGPSGIVGAQELNGQSLPANGITNYTLNPPITLVSNSFDSSFLRVTTRIGSILGGNAVRQNDSAVREVELANYYAYDDGTAESGYGIRNSNGSVAYGFSLETGDSLRGVWIHFTQAEARVINGFTLNVWSRIAPVNQPSNAFDKIVYSLDAGRPVYTDSINGFHLYLFDSAVYVDSKFYVGWTQNSSFLLNVGLDRNYRHNGLVLPNPNLFFNIGGSWKNATVPGTIMMRPVMGKKWPEPLIVKETKTRTLPNVFPNPTGKSFQIKCEYELKSISLCDIKGRELGRWSEAQTHYDVSEYEPGIYAVRMETLSGEWLNCKLIIFR